MLKGGRTDQRTLVKLVCLATVLVIYLTDVQYTQQHQACCWAQKNKEYVKPGLKTSPRVEHSKKIS